jgi:hypothetical protein
LIQFLIAVKYWTKDRLWGHEGGCSNFGRWAERPGRRGRVKLEGAYCDDCGTGRGWRTLLFVDRVTGDVVDNGQHVLIGAYHQTLQYLV